MTPDRDRIQTGEVTSWVTALRPPKAPADPFKPHGFFLEQERSAAGRAVSSACILLTNKECPWRCLMCDLWKHTLDGPTPPGAVPAQIHYALDRLASKPEQVKLYNSGSFFDAAAIPPADYPAIAAAVAFAQHVIVESHPRLVGGRTWRLRELLSGSLEVALGLETIHPRVLPRLNKRFSLEDFSRSAEALRRERIGLRVFLLVKPPFLDDAEAVTWAIRSAEFAFERGATAVTLIPTRPGNGALDQLIATGEFSPPNLRTLEEALAQVLALRRGRAFADTWDLEQFSTCPACLEARKSRLEQMNLAQEVLPPVRCSLCGGA
jgi:radical SAM enzyme (TIGR01210 family)